MYFAKVYVNFQLKLYMDRIKALLDGSDLGLLCTYPHREALFSPAFVLMDNGGCYNGISEQWFNVSDVLKGSLHQRYDYIVDIFQGIYVQEICTAAYLGIPLHEGLPTMSLRPC